MSYPFMAIDTLQATSGGQVVLTYQVPTNKKFTIHNVIFASDGTFSVIEIKSSRGNNYSNASNAEAIPSTLLPLGTNQFNTPRFPIQPLTLEGGDEFSVTVLDTSGAANDIWMLLNGYQEDR